MFDPLDRSIYPIDPWRVIETSLPGDPAHSESVFALGNGFVGVRGVREEDEPVPTCFVNGFFETWPIKYPEDAYGLARVGQAIRPAPMSAQLVITVDGHRLGRHDASDGQPIAQRRELDMTTGVLTRETTWPTPSGQVTVRARRLVSLTQRGLVASVIDIVPQHPTHIEVRHVLGSPQYGPINSQGFDPRSGTVLDGVPVQVEHRAAHDEQALLRVRTRRADRWLTCAVDHRLSADGSPVAISSTAVGADDVQVTWDCQHAGSVTLVVFGYYTLDDHRDGDDADDAAAASAALAQAHSLGWDSLVLEQTAWLRDFWSVADIEVDEPSLQQAIRWSTFQTIQSSARADGHGVSAKGVTGSGYDGHYFWDMEMYVLPLLTYTCPTAARAALGFRLATLPQAQDRAKELSLAGALFPWRTIDGREASAYFPAGTAQYHIDADIAHALAQYLAATGDDSIMAAGGTDLVVETARMWASLGFWGEDGQFHIHYVTGPDEYSALVDDNVYTNVMARANLRFAADAAQRRGDADAAEIAQWRHIADGMYVPFDASRGVHPQDAHFLGRQPWDIASIPKKNFPLLLHYHPLTIYRHQVLKQADVVLAQIICSDDFTADQKRANFDFYDPLTTGDSTLSAVPQAIAAAEAGHLDLARDYLEQAAFVDLADTHGNTDAGVHVAVAAGVWNVLVSGFGGLRDSAWGSGAGTAPVVSLNPQLPTGWKSLKFRLLVRGTKLTVSVTAGVVELEADGPVTVTVWGRRVDVTPNKTLTVEARTLPQRPTF